MKIAHIADVHIRGLQYMDEIKYTFEQLEKSLKDKKPDLIFIGGDLYHNKLTVTNEYFLICFEFLQKMSMISKVLVIPGNHDLALNNLSRIDAITPVIKALDDDEIIYSKHTELAYTVGGKFNFWHFSCLDEKEEWPTFEKSIKGWYEHAINIALYHGTIDKCIVDNGWVSRGNRDGLEIFKGFDFALLGDIHKHQFMTDRIAYPGSLRQNNFGEDLEKGYLFWDIKSKDNFKAEFIALKQKRNFYTIKIDSIKNFRKDLDIPKDNRIRVKPTNKISEIDKIKIKEKIKTIYEPCNDVPILPYDDAEEDHVYEFSDGTILDDNIRLDEIQKKFIKEYFSDRGLKKKELEELYEIDKQYQTYIDKNVLRNITWDIKKFWWDNYFSYGPKNFIDFEKTAGVVGVFGENGIGKSSIIDSICINLFNNTTKPKALNFADYVHTKKKVGKSKIKIECDNKTYFVEKKTTISVTKDKKRKSKNEADFYVYDNKQKISKNGEKITDTAKNIEKTFGTLDEFLTMNLIPQWGITNFIDKGGTDRKNIIYKFFDLDIFSQKNEMASKHLKDLKKSIVEYEDINFYQNFEILNLKEKNLKKQIKDQDKELNFFISKISEIEKSIEKNKKFIDSEKLSRYKSVIQNIENNEKKLNTLEKDLSTKSKTIKDIISLTKDFDVSKYEKELERDKKELKKKYELEIQLNNLKKSADLIKKIPGEDVCKTCVLAKDSFDCQKKIPKIEKQFDSIVVLSKKEKDEKKYKYDKIIEKQKLEFESSLLEEKIQSLKKDIKSFKKEELDLKKFIKNTKEVEKIVSKLSELESIKSETEKQISLLKNKNFLSAKELGSIESKRETLQEKENKLKEISKNISLYEYYTEAMGKNGIPYMIITKKIPKISSEVNKILSQVVNFTLQIENNLQEKSIKIYITDSKKGKRIIESTSGAEKTIAAIALRAALWKISSLPKCQLLILDEPFGYLDSKKFDGVIRLLDYLKSYFKNIIVITHNEEIKSVVDYSLYVKESESGFANVRN